MNKTSSLVVKVAGREWRRRKRKKGENNQKKKKRKRRGEEIEPRKRRKRSKCDKKKKANKKRKGGPCVHPLSSEGREIRHTRVADTIQSLVNVLCAL